MSVKLRLRRQGRKGLPYYHIVAADARSPRDGKFLESIGVYNPNTRPATIEVNQELALKWLRNGAQPTDTVRAIFRYTGVNLKHALITQGKTEEQIAAIYNRWLEQKQSDIQGAKTKLADAKAAEQKERLARESKVRAEKAAAIVAKNTPAPEAPAAEEEAPAAEGENTEA